MRAGGIETYVLNILNRLDRERFSSVLFLRQNKGQLLDRVAADVSVIHLRGRRSALLPVPLAIEIASQQLDVIYSGTNAVNAATAAAVSLLPSSMRPIVILSEHTSAFSYLAEAKWPTVRRSTLRRLYRRADVLVCPLEGICAEWREALGLPDLRTAALPNPVIDPHQLLPLVPRPRGGNLHLVSAGRLVPAKGHDVLIDAFARLYTVRSDVRLTIYGEGEARAALQHRIAEQGLAEVVHLAGYVSDLVQVLANADIFVLPSRREGFGNVVVEALAAGLPVIATECLGPRNILLEGALGVLVPVDDVESLAAALISVAGSIPSLAAARIGRARALEFSVDAALRAFETLVTSLPRRSL